MFQRNGLVYQQQHMAMCFNYENKSLPHRPVCNILLYDEVDRVLEYD